MKDKDHGWGKLTTSFTQSHSILWQKNIFKKKLVHTILSLLASPRQPIKSKLKKRRSRILLQQRSFLAIKATDTSAVGDYEHWEHYGTFVRIIWEPLRLFEDYVGTNSFPSESYLQCFFCVCIKICVHCSSFLKRELSVTWKLHIICTTGALKVTNEPEKI